MATVVATDGILSTAAVEPKMTRSGPGCGDRVHGGAMATVPRPGAQGGKRPDCRHEVNAGRGEADHPPAMDGVAAGEDGGGGRRDCGSAIVETEGAVRERKGLSCEWAWEVTRVMGEL